MTMLMRFILSVLLLAVLMTGCARRFSGDFEFRNRSNTNLYVEIYGFERNPPVGLLYPTGNNGSDMGAMPLPPQAILTWSETYETTIKTEHGSSFGRDVLNNPYMLNFDSPTNGVAIATMRKPESHTETFLMSSISNWSPNAALFFEFGSNRVWKVSCKSENK